MGDHIRSLCCNCAAPICNWLLSSGGGRKPQPMKGQKIIADSCGEHGRETIYITVECPLFEDDKNGGSEPGKLKKKWKLWTKEEDDILLSMRAEGATFLKISCALEDRDPGVIASRFKRLQRT